MISKHAAWLENSEGLAPRAIMKKVFLKTSKKIARKHLCWGLFLNKVAGWKPATSSNRDSGTGTFL